jgi:hypothetical protein
MRILQFGFLAFALASLSFAAPIDDERLQLLEDQALANNKLLNRAEKIFATETGITENTVPPVYQELGKSLDNEILESAKRIQEGRKSVYGMRQALVNMDQPPVGGYALEGLFIGRKKFKEELAVHDIDALNQKKDHDAQLASTRSEGARRALQAVLDNQAEQAKNTRGTIVSKIRLAQDLIDDRIKLLGVPAMKLNEKADALELQLRVVENQFQNVHGSLNAYRAKIRTLYLHRDSTGAIRTH